MRSSKSIPRLKEVLQNLFKQRVLDLFLALSPLFSSLTSEERGEIFKRFHLHKIPEETILFKGGDPPDSLYMVKKWRGGDIYSKPSGEKGVLGH